MINHFFDCEPKFVGFLIKRLIALEPLSTQNRLLNSRHSQTTNTLSCKHEISSKITRYQKQNSFENFTYNNSMKQFTIINF
jgi:hypothetical protein